MAKSDLNSIYTIEKKENEFVLNSEDGLLRTPGGYVVSDKNKKLLQYINKDIAVNASLDASILGYYSVYSTYKEFFRDNTDAISKEDFRQTIESDITINTVAGPECIDQLNCWEALTNQLERAGLQHTIFGWTPRFEKIADYFYQIYESLIPAQKTAVINSAQVHGSIIYGILLATGNCNEKEYGIAIAAGNCIIPGVFGDVTKSGFNHFVSMISKEAKILTTFVKLIKDHG